MSRRTRIRGSRQGSGLGMSHHAQYSGSSTHFPSSYSILGSPIAPPARLMPLLETGRINCVCEEGELLSDFCPLLNVQAELLQQATAANITLVGKVVQQQSKVVNQCVFAVSMALCCVLGLLGNSSFRRRFFTRYCIQIEEYIRLGSVISHLVRCHSIIVNIQDNELTQQKMNTLVEAILAAHLKQPQPQPQPITDQPGPHKTVTIRNHCYNMKDFDLQGTLKKLEEHNIEALFVWEKQVARTSNSWRTEQRQGLLKNYLQC